MSFRAVNKFSAHSASVEHGSFRLKYEQNYGSSLNNNAEGTAPSGPYVSLRPLVVSLIENSFLGFG